MHKASDRKHTRITLAPKLEVDGHLGMVDIREIKNLYDFLGYEEWSEGKEIRMTELPILEQKNDAIFECLQNPVILAPSLKCIQPSHIYCLIMDLSTHSEIEAKKIKSFLFHLSSNHQPIEAVKLAVKELFLDSVLMDVFQENFTAEGSAVTVDDIERFFGGTISASTINRIKRDCGATKPRKVKLSIQSTPEKWNSFAIPRNALPYDEVMILLKVPKKIEAFNKMVECGQLEDALERLNAFIEQKKSA